MPSTGGSIVVSNSRELSELIGLFLSATTPVGISTEGVSPLASSLNSFRDVYEGFDYALARLKIAQLFATVITRDSEWGLVNEGNHSGTVNADFKNGGPGFFDLNPSEDAKFLSVNDPGNATQDFWNTCLSIAIKSLDIPFSFFKEDYTNFSGNKMALTIYLNAIRDKRADVIDFLNDWLCWRINWGVALGEISLPAGFICDPTQWEWIPNGLPWWDPREVQSDINLIRSRMISRTQITRERLGVDWEKIILPQIEREEQLLAERGITDYLPAQIDNRMAIDE